MRRLAKTFRSTVMADALYRAGIGVQVAKPPEPIENPNLPRSSVDAVILGLSGPNSSLLRQRGRAVLTLRDLAEKEAEREARTRGIRQRAASG